jgi:hypothetical protein
VKHAGPVSHKGLVAKRAGPVSEKGLVGPVSENGLVVKRAGPVPDEIVARRLSDTLVGTLRNTYGDDFAKGSRDSDKLSTVIKKRSDSVLQNLDHKLKDVLVLPKRKSANNRSVASLANTMVIFGSALKKLADQ